jgi:Tfp pilus assembly protein PilN
MPNGNKNNNKKEIELLPAELRRPEEKKGSEERPEVKFFIPPAEKKSERPSFVGKVAGPVPAREETPGADLSVFKMQKEVKRPPVPPPPPPRVAPPREPKIMPSRPVLAPKAAQKIVKQVSQKQPAGQKIGITLMPVETAVSRKEAKRAGRIALIILLAVLLALLAGGAYFLVEWYVGQVDLELQKINTNLENVTRQIKDLDTEKIQAQILQKQLKAANNLLGDHIYWTNLFAFLEKDVVSDVYFLNLTGVSDGQISMSGVAKSYRAVSRQITSFRSDERVDTVSILSASASVDPEGNVAEINFETKLKLNPEIFLK